MRIDRFKIIYLALLGSIITFNCDRETTYRQVLTDMQAGDTLYLSLLTEKGWGLKVFPEGAGRISFGSKPSESLPFPERTFDFASLANTLQDAPQHTSPEEGFVITISFRAAEQKGNKPRYLKDFQLAHELFEKAYHAAMHTQAPVYNKRRVKKRYRQRRPVPAHFLENG